MNTTYNYNSLVNSEQTNSDLSPKYDENSFKENMAGIENYWKELKTELEQKKKDITDLNRIHNLYKSDEFLSVINDIEKKIKENEEKLCFIQKVIWDVRSRIIFSK